MGEVFFQKLWGRDYRRLIGEQFVSEEVDDGIVFYKPKYSFLGGVCQWNTYKVREDFLVSPTAALCKCPDHNCLYVERKYSQDGVKIGHFRQISEIDQAGFKTAKFEEVIGLKLHEQADVGYLYHTYSSGIELLGVHSIPKSFKDRLRKILADGMVELAKSGIDYNDPFPSNLRYSFDSKLICNPHNCIQIHDSELPIEEQIKNLSSLLYTNIWIESPEEFLDDYFNGALFEDKSEWIKKRIMENVRLMDQSNDVPEMPFYWRPRWGRKMSFCKISSL